MSVPNPKDFRIPILSILSEGKYREEEIREKLVKDLDLSDSDISEKTSKGESVFKSRVYQGVRYLSDKKRSLIKVRLRVYEITSKGKDYLKKNKKSEPEGNKSEEGYVYYIQEGIDGNITIGYSTDPTYRLSKHQRSNSNILRILAYVKGSLKYEKKIHKRFKDCKIAGEWFKPDLKLLKHIEQEKSKIIVTTLNLSDENERLKSRIKELEDR